MIKLNPYLNFLGKTEEAFNFYKSVFGGEFAMVQRFKDVSDSDMPDKGEMADEDMDKIMHVSLPIGDNVLMGTDALESAGHTVTVGDSISLSVSVDSKEEADRVFEALQEDGSVEMPMEDTFWGAYLGIVEDKFGIRWMISFDKNYQ